MLFSVEQAFVGREEIRAPLKTPTWEATSIRDSNISRGCGKMLEILEGREGKFSGSILENPEGRGSHTANPFRGGGMDYFLEPHNLK